MSRMGRAIKMGNNGYNSDEMKDDIMRLLVDTGAPAECLSSDTTGETVDRMVQELTKMNMLNTTLFDGVLNNEICGMLVFTAIMYSQVLRDIDKYNIIDIVDVAQYMSYRGIRDQSLEAKIVLYSIMGDIGPSDIVPLVGMIAIAYLEKNTDVNIRMVRSIDNFLKTGNIDDLVYNI